MTPLLACQHALLNALWARPHAADDVKKLIANNSINTSSEALKIYQSNAGGTAQRALQAAYPVVTALLSEDSMGQLARALWFAHPPQRGDLACWGGELAAFIAASDQLAELPWLPDLARLEWAVHQAHTAADAATPSPNQPAGEGGVRPLADLAQTDPATHTLVLAAGARVVRLDWAVHAIWHAHQLPTATERDAAVAELATTRGQAPCWASHQPQWLRVWRPLHQVRCEPVPPQHGRADDPGAAQTDAQTHAQTEARWLALLNQGTSLLDALYAADPGFATWLPQAAASGLVQGLRPLTLTALPTVTLTGEAP